MMIKKIFLFLTGFGLMIIGFSTIILYINLLALGYNFKEYIIFIIKLPEFYYIFIGFIIVNISLIKRGDKVERSIWYCFEF